MKYYINYKNKYKLLENLKNNVYCRIKKSEVHGIGVFAIKDIPTDTNPFENTIGCDDKNVVTLNESDIKHLSKGVKKMIDSFYHQSDGQYIIPIRGLNSLDISYYLNHSKDPNLTHYQDHNCGMFSFKSLKEIKKGDELFINYKEYDN
jgi:SET domain-containing protein